MPCARLVRQSARAVCAARRAEAGVQCRRAGRCPSATSRRQSACGHARARRRRRRRCGRRCAPRTGTSGFCQCRDAPGRPT
eukprot:1469967-Prymnesium_polylepis.1